LVGVEAIPQSAETRKSFVELFQVPSVKHYSATHEGTGFKAASVRAVISTAHALGRRNCEHSVHERMQDAAEWHGRQQAKIGRMESPVVIARALETLRRHQRERFP
jgi:hypothetical protein